ncbi:MAG TPA: carbohydrate porin [Hanamia sp.]|nr:carbohydrate porin [Hanamia sp.]
MKNIIVIFVFYLFNFSFVSAQTTIDSLGEINSTAHFQLTVISQNHFSFKSLYSGRNSLSNDDEWGATSITSTLFLGKKLWKDAAFYFDPEISGGEGLSGSVGVAGALNGETYRVGSSAPSVFIARAYFQQQIPLSTSYENVDDDINQIKGKAASERIVLSAGKFAISDFFDNNEYSHDPRTQFLNWSLMSDGAWDYPANTRGYTFGIVAEYFKQNWAFRLSSVAVPSIANSPKMEYDFSKAHSETFEIEKKIFVHKMPGTLRFLFSEMFSRAPSYQQGIKALQSNNNYVLNVISGDTEGKTYGGKKFTMGFSGDQQLGKSLGIFMRAGWNDGKYATWAFTEIDATASAGISINGNKWNRAKDILGIAAVVNGISSDHRNFLKAGGYGFIIGDGKLNYAHEGILEAYYNALVTNFFSLTLDYQFVNNPAYNKDRGPVNAFAIRGHVSF